MGQASRIDPDIAADFSSDTPPPSASGARIDDDIAADFADHSIEEPKRGSNIVNSIHALGSGALHSVVGGYKGLYTLATTGDAGKAAHAVEAEQGKAYHAPEEDLSAAPPNLRPFIQQSHQLPSGTELGDFAERHGASPGVSTTLAVLPSAAAAMMAPRSMGKIGPTMTAEDVANQSRSGQSLGAAADGGGAVSKLTPETKAELVKAGQQGLPINQTALERHSVAESLPIPQRLTRGMATGHGPTYSEEFNSRRTNPEIGAHLDNLNQGLIDNVDELRRQASPHVVGNNVIDNSQSLIDAHKAVADARDAAITDAYKQAKAVGGNKLNMDGQSFIDEVNAKLEDPKISEFLPDKVKKVVVDSLVKKGPENMTLDDYLTAQKVLGRAQRAAQDGNEIHAIGAVRDSLENTGVAPGTAAAAKEAYAKASALAKANFDDLKTNPAYKAAYEDREITPTGEESDLNKTFAQKYVLGGSRANLQRMREMLLGDSTANETMTAVALNHLRESAGIKPGFTDGSFSQNGYNGAWASKIEPRARELLQDPQLIEHAQNLGKVASWEMPRSKSTYVNSSNTAVADRPLTSAVKAGIGHASDAATELLPGPGRAAVKLGKVYLNAKSEAKAAAAAEAQRQAFVRETIKPGAGLTYQP